MSSDSYSSLPEGMKMLVGRAAEGDGLSQHTVGKTFYYGHGVPVDIEKGLYWNRMAAEQGFADAQYWLARRFYKGEVVAQDFPEAVKWYRLAAEQGHAKAISQRTGSGMRYQ